MMNKIFYFSTVLVALLLLTSCHEKTSDQSLIKHITLDVNIDETPHSLSEEFTDFEIIPLENRTECALKDVRKMVVSDAGMYIFDAGVNSQVHSFSLSGKYRGLIGRRGHAKGEYQAIINIASNERGDTVAILSYPSIYLYSGSGNYLSTLDVKNDNGAEDLLITESGYYLGYFHNQGEGVVSIYDKELSHITDLIKTSGKPTSNTLNVDNGHIIQQDSDYIYCLDPLKFCFYVSKDNNPNDVTKYSFRLRESMGYSNITDGNDANKPHIVSYQVHNGVIRGVVESPSGFYDFRSALLSGKVVLMRHCDLNYAFDCCHHGYFYKIVDATTLQDYLNKDKRHMEPIRKLLGKNLSDLADKVTLNDNAYIMRMRLK